MKYKITIELIPQDDDSKYPDGRELYSQVIDDLNVSAVVTELNSYRLHDENKSASPDPQGRRKVQMSNCSRCGALIDDPDIQQAADRELNYRENFPETWDAEKGRVPWCTDCFEEANAEDDTKTWEVLHDE